MIRKYYGRSIVAVLLIPAVSVVSARIFDAIDPELARGHTHYARNFAMLWYLRHGLWWAGFLLVGVLWLLSCAWLVRAKSLRQAWLWLALVGPPGFAVLMALADHAPLLPGDAYRRQLERLPRPLRVLYEVLRFAAFDVVTRQLIEWVDRGAAIAEAARRSVALSQVLAERDASSGMWALGDAMREAYLFVLLYAIWPAGYNALAALIRRLWRRGAAVGS